MARLHRETRDEERDEPPRYREAARGFVVIRGGSLPRRCVVRNHRRGNEDQPESREHEVRNDRDRVAFEQETDPRHRRHVADRAPQPDVDVPRRALPEPAQGQRLELGQRSLPEETEREERREEAPEPGYHRDGGEGEERPRRRDAHHALARTGPIGRVAPEPRGDELGHREGREEDSDRPRVDPPVEKIGGEVGKERAGRREVREVPAAKPRKAGSWIQPEDPLARVNRSAWIREFVSSTTARRHRHGAWSVADSRH